MFLRLDFVRFVKKYKQEPISILNQNQEIQQQLNQYKNTSKQKKKPEYNVLESHWMHKYQVRILNFLEY